MAFKGYKTIETENQILGFFEKYRPFSNFHQEEFTWCGITWKTGEHAFHAAKTLDENWQMAIRNSANPSEAKKLGRQCPLRSDWELVKIDIMYSIVLARFQQSEILKALLLSTGNKYLEETNDWGDTCWGRTVPKGLSIPDWCAEMQRDGDNNLGEILMRVREDIRNGN